ncbi:MAG: tetratricopeptide repeat protein [Candidatus Omnitrophota bacterium]
MSTITGEKRGVPLRQKILLLSLGVLIFFVLVEVLLRLAGWISLGLQEQKNLSSIRGKEAYRIMCLGESTTVMGGDDSYPAQLEEILNKRNPGAGFSVINKGVSGVQISYLLEQLEENLTRYRPDMVTAMAGINDEWPYLPYSRLTPSRARRFIESLRVYKLICLMRLHILAKMQEKGLFVATVIKNNPYSGANDEEKSESEHIFPGKALDYSSNNKQPTLEGKDYFMLAEEKIAEARYLKAEEYLIKALKAHPDDGNIYVRLGACCRNLGKIKQSKEALQKALSLNPGNYTAYLELGWLYRDQKDLFHSEDMFKKAIAINPRSDWAYAGLGICYRDRNEYHKAEGAFAKAIALNPKNEWAYFELGWLYRETNKLKAAEQYFRKAAELKPKDDERYFVLGQVCKDQAKLIQAEGLYKKALAINPNNDRVVSGLALLYEETGRPDLAQEYYKRADDLRANYYSPQTRSDYRKIRAILDKKGVKLVCIQYPMRSLKPLKQVFSGEKEGIVFVDNEKIFKDAVKQRGYNTYFRDMFAGDFGHCTREGNRLLAENIADAICPVIAKAR